MHILPIGTLGLLEISTASLACVAVADMSPFLSGSSIPGLTGSILRGWESCGCTGYACRRWAGILKAGLWMNRELSMVAGTPRSFTKEVSSAMLVPVAGERSSSHALLSHLGLVPNHKRMMLVVAGSNLPRLKSCEGFVKQYNLWVGYLSNYSILNRLTRLSDRSILRWLLQWTNDTTPCAGK